MVLISCLMIVAAILLFISACCLQTDLLNNILDLDKVDDKDLLDAGKAMISRIFIVGGVSLISTLLLVGGVIGLIICIAKN